MAKKKNENQRQQEQRQEVTQLLRQAASNGNLGGREFKEILDAGGNANRILERAVANKGLTIASGVVNAYNKGEYFTPKDYYKYSTYNQPFNPIINQIKSAGTLDPKSALFIGSRGSTATVLPRAMGAGGTKTKAPIADPISNDAGLNQEPLGSDYGGDVSDAGGFDTGFNDATADNTADNTNMLQGSTLGGGDGMAGALGIKSKKSSRRQAGVASKGTSQLNRDSLKIALNFG